MYKLYAAYGSNMNIAQMNLRCPKARPAGTAWLKDYRLTFRGKSRGVANIEQAVGGQVPVVLWQITEDCEAALDIYEGYPHLYKKKNVIVTSSGEEVTAMAYVMCSRYESLPAVPTANYFEIIREGYADHRMNCGLLDDVFVKVCDEIMET